MMEPSNFRKGQRTFFGFLVQNRQLGDVTLAIKRDGVSREVRVPLTEKIGFAHLVALFYEVKPRYFILGGMVFQPLSLNFLHAFGGGLGWYQSAPVALVNTYLNGKPEAKGREEALLSQVLADQANVGYHERANNINTLALYPWREVLRIRHGNTIIRLARVSRWEEYSLSEP